MGNATNETAKKTNWLDAIKAQFKRIIWPTKEEAARRSAVEMCIRDRCVAIVGDEHTVRHMIENEKQQKRYTSLNLRLREMNTLS